MMTSPPQLKKELSWHDHAVQVEAVHAAAE
jgi:hypothetical protein